MKKLKSMFGLWLAVVVAAAMLAVPTFAVGSDESDEGSNFKPWTGQQEGDVFFGDGVVSGKVGVFTSDGAEVTSGDAGESGGAAGPVIYYYSLNSSASGGGSISPEGYTSVVMGGSQTYTITPDAGMHIKDVYVDGKNVGAVESYTFENVWGSHTIEVVFSDWVHHQGICPGENGCPINQYPDADREAWYHDGLHFCIENGLLKGSNGKIDPDGEATRAMAITMLWRINDCPTVDGDIKFKDVKEGAWYAEALRWAQHEGLALGYGDGTYFGPNDNVTREQLITILWRYAQWQGHDVSEGEDTNILSFDDAFEVSEYAIPAIQWACATGMLQGVDTADGGKIIDPKAKSTRAQLATFMMRHLEHHI